MSKTIVAIATPGGKSAISVIRMSGDDTMKIADSVFKGVSGKPLSLSEGYTAHLGRVFDQNGEIDEVIATIFRDPKSFTGEDTVEFSCHGGSYIAHRLLTALINNGAQPAWRGEFTRRAVMSGKLTLTQAEAINEIISAENNSALKAALSQYDGALFRQIEDVKNQILEIAAAVTAVIDFPEDDITETANEHISGEIERILAALDGLIKGYDKGCLIRNGIATAIIGKPNVGKSTLMNLLCGNAKSIITLIPGTTRDIIEETVDIGGICLNIADTAGIHRPKNEVERIGVDLASGRIKSSDLVLAVFDLSRLLDDDDFAILEKLDKSRTLGIFNKADLPHVAKVEELGLEHTIKVSGIEQSSLNEIYSFIYNFVMDNNFDPDSGMIFSLRQLECAQRARVAAADALTALTDGAPDAACVCLESAAGALAELTGDKVTDNLLDRIFSRFCIGK